MDTPAHANIFRAAWQSLPERHRRRYQPTEALLFDAGNYPDYFDDPTRPEAEKLAMEPEWRRFCRLDAPFGVAGLHFWASPVAAQFDRIPLYRWQMERMLDCLNAKDWNGFLKFAGCLSHALGDATQPAHIGPESKLLEELLPVPERPELRDFHFHSTVEHVIGACGALPEPALLGASLAEAAWRLAARTQEAVGYCRRFLIPTIQALYANDRERAEQLAAEPVTIAARLTRDAMFTVLELSDGAADGKCADSVDLTRFPPFAGEHDMVYGGPVPDGNKDVPPNNAPVTPGELLTATGRRTVLPGLGMLPGSGMVRARDAWSSWKLPPGVFRRFAALAGLNAAIGRDGAVEFRVELDGVLKWSSGRMTAETTAKPVDVPLGDAAQLTLRVVDANGGRTFWHNHAYWGKPRLER